MTCPNCGTTEAPFNEFGDWLECVICGHTYCADEADDDIVEEEAPTLRELGIDV